MHVLCRKQVLYTTGKMSSNHKNFTQLWYTPNHLWYAEHIKSSWKRSKLKKPDQYVRVCPPNIGGAHGPKVGSQPFWALLKLVMLLWVLFLHLAFNVLVSVGWLIFLLDSQVCMLQIYVSNEFFHWRQVSWQLQASYHVFSLENVPVRTVNRQCSSGLQAVAAIIKAGCYDISM